MTAVAISDFRAHIHDYLQKVKQGEEIMLTSRGQEIATIVPPKASEAEERLKAISLSAEILDVVSPTESTWELS